MDQPNNNNSNMNHGQGCKCGVCNGGYYTNGHRMGFTLLRWLLGIIVILMVFSLGMSIGEFKGEIMGGGMYGRDMMYQRAYAVPMMGTTVVSPAVPVTPAK
jgi:hypothetical protein